MNGHSTYLNMFMPHWPLLNCLVTLVLPYVSGQLLEFRLHMMQVLTALPLGRCAATGTIASGKLADPLPPLLRPLPRPRPAATGGTAAPLPSVLSPSLILSTGSGCRRPHQELRSEWKRLRPIY